MLLFAASASTALTLGRMQGVALIGRPLDVGIPFTLDAPGDSLEACTEVDVFYGDLKVDPRRVTLLPSSGGMSGSLRVQVANPVDEAFVQVYLRVGCTARYTRRYVLLTEQPADVAEAAAVPAPASPVVTALVTPAPGSGSSAPAIAPSAAMAGAPAESSAPRPAPRVAARTMPADADAVPAPRPASRPAPARQPAQQSAPSVPPPAVAAPVERPRLRLDPIEISPAAGPGAVGPDLGPDGVVQALQAQELDRNAQRIQSLEADLRKLREGMLRSDAGLIELRARLEKAEGERYANGLVYTLAGLLAAALGGVVLLWRRSRAAAQGDPWWRESQMPPAASSSVTQEEHLFEESSLAAAPASLPAAASRSRPVPPAAQVPQVPDTLRILTTGPGALAAGAMGGAGGAGGAGTVRRGDPVSQPGSLSGRVPTGFGFLGNVEATRDAQLTQGDGLRVSDPLPVTSDELSDIQQEADFFVSLGEHARAIEILRNHIEAHPQASAVAWLDLLAIHHKLGQKDEYEQVRRDFEWLFNAKAPSFTEYHEARDGIEGHPRLVSRIQAAWPRREVLDLIDDAVFRRPGAEGEEPINLEGYRDLLFLHTIASELSADNTATQPARHEAAATTAVAREAAGAGASLPPVDVQHLDINLDEPLAPLPALNPAAVARSPVGEGPGAPAGKGRSMADEGRLMDFDIDLQPQFKLPSQRPAQG